MRLLDLLKMDVLFQVRHGFYYAYALVSAFYIGVLLFLPESIIQEASIFIIFTDPSVLGFFFVGGLVLLERNQSIFNSLFVTPISIHAYLWSKVLSLTLLATITSSFIFYFIHHHSFAFLPFMMAVLFCSVFFTLLGIVLAVRVPSINAFLYTSPLLVIIFYLPLLNFINVDSQIFYILPTQAILILLEGSFHELSFNMYSYATITCIIWIGVAYFWAYYETNQFLKNKCFQ
jgi:fluoroquinolone transport system permease protein